MRPCRLEVDSILSLVDNGVRLGQLPRPDTIEATGADKSFSDGLGRAADFDRRIANV